MNTILFALDTEGLHDNIILTEGTSQLPQSSELFQDPFEAESGVKSDKYYQGLASVDPSPYSVSQAASSQMMNYFLAGRRSLLAGTFHCK